MPIFQNLNIQKLTVMTSLIINILLAVSLQQMLPLEGTQGNLDFTFLIPQLCVLGVVSFIFEPEIILLQL